MHRFIFYAICTAIMAVFCIFLRWLYVGISVDFGTGLVTGVGLMAALFWLADRFTATGSGGR